MSNLTSCFHHVQLQWRWLKRSSREYWHRTGAPLVFLNDTLLSPLFATLVLFVLATYINAFMSVYSDQSGATVGDPLKDRLHAILPYYNNRPLMNEIILILVLVSLFRFLPFWNGMSWRKSVALLRRFLFLEALVQILRGLAMGATSYNPPDPNCVKVAFGNIFMEGFHMISGSAHTCADMMFSGHTGLYTLLALFWTFYSQGEEFNMCLPRRWHAKNVAPQEGADERDTVDARPTSPGPKGRRESESQQPYTGVSTGAAGGDAALEDPYVSFTDASPLNWPPSRRSYHLIDFIVWPVINFCTILLIWTRYHYTLDAFMGFLVAQALFRVYHLALETVEWKLRHGECNAGHVGDAAALAGWTLPERFLLWFEHTTLYRPTNGIARAGAVDMSQMKSERNGVRRVPSALPLKQLPLAPANSFEKRELDLEEQVDDMHQDKYAEFEREKRAQV